MNFLNLNTKYQIFYNWKSFYLFCLALNRVNNQNMYSIDFINVYIFFYYLSENSNVMKSQDQ